MMPRIVLPALLLVQVLCGTSALSQIVVSDEPLQEFEIVAQMPLVGYRSVPTDIFVNASGQWSIKSKYIYQAIKENPSAVGIIDADKVDSISPNDLVKTIRSRYNTESSTFHKPAILNTSGKLSNKSNSSNIDTIFILNAVASGAISERNSNTSLTVDPKFAQKMVASYKHLDSLDKSSLNKENSSAISNSIVLANSDLSFRNVYTATLTKVSFGKPLAYSYKEKNLLIEPSLLKKYDVYWIDFAVSDADLSNSVADEFSFMVNAPDSTIALELVPTRYGIEEVTTKELKSPDIKVETPAGAISLGTVYGQTVEYRHLKPTIVATGLQENRFGWILKDEMIDQGTKRFSVIIGVEKNSKSITVEIVSTAKTKGSWVTQDQVAATEPKMFEISLPK
jgi:hypothetical protein